MSVVRKKYPIVDENGQSCTFPTFASQVFFDDGSVLEGKKFGGGTASDSEKLGGKVPEYYTPYTNYADNSDFTHWVAQAGINAAHGTEWYGGDRWILTDGTITGTANTDGDGYSEITLNGTLVQVVSSPPAVATAFVEMVSGTAEISYDASVGEIVLISGGGVIKNVLLLEGEWEDKPEYVSKGYATELTECQRYFLTGVGVHTVGHGGTIDSKLFYISIPTPTTMCRNPVCIIDLADNVVFGTTSGYSICGVSSVVSAGVKPNAVFVELNLATKSPQNYATGSTFSTLLTLVADLPRR